MQERLSVEGVNRFLQKYEDDEHEVYGPALILKLRVYFWRLSKIDQREFLGAGVRCDLDREVLEKVRWAEPHKQETLRQLPFGTSGHFGTQAG